MGLKLNPLTAQFDLVGSGGGGASYIDGEVATYNDLPLDGTAALNSAWLVREASGIWPVSRKQAGIYIRTATAGSSRDADYTYAGTMPDVFSDAVFTLYDDASTTRTGQFNLGSITAGQNRVLTWPDGNGTIARTSDIPAAFDPANPGTIGGTTPAAATFTNLTANTRVNLPNTNGTTAGDIYRNADTLRYRDSTNTERTLLSGAGNLANLTDTATARTNIGLGSASSVTFGDIQNTPIGSTTRNTGAFTTLNANNGTVTTSTPALIVAQTINSVGTAFRLVDLSFTNTNSSSNSEYINCSTGGASNFIVRRDGTVLATTYLSSNGFRAVGNGNSGGQVILSSNGYYCFNDSTTSTFGTQDLFLRRDAAGILAQHNLANPQAFRLYNTTDAGLTNFERLSLRWASNVAIIGTEAGGSGSARNLELRAGAATYTFTTPFTASPNATVNHVSIQAAGDTTNVSLSLVPKGSGALSARVPTGTGGVTGGGNARGAGAVDWQISTDSFSAAADVASGTSAVICGGVRNRCNGTEAIVGGGSGNNASSTKSAILCGNTNASSAAFSTVINGDSSQATADCALANGRTAIASGASSVAIGNTATASASNSLAFGANVLANRIGMQAYAAGQFAAQGDAQRARFVLRCKTTTNAAVEMALDGGTTYLTIPNGKVMFLNIKVVGTKSDGMTVATYERQYAAKNLANVSSEVFAPVTIGTDLASGTTLEVATVDAGDYIRIRPTGVLNETWRWVASVDAVECSYGT